MTSSTASIINTDLVLLDVNVEGAAGDAKKAVIGRLVGRLADAGRTTDADGLIAAALAREEQSATGLPGGIAIPHCRSPFVDTASIGFARLNPAVDFGAPDGPADLAFLIAAPEAGGAEHMKLLSSLARALVRKDFVESLRNAATPAEVVALVDSVINIEKPAEKPAATTEPVQEQARTLVAVTACPTGIAHTYMAADSLVAAAKKAGVTVHVETQGSSGSTPLDPSTIAEADAVIFATDVGVKDKHRFAGKPVVASGVKRAINEPDKMIAEALGAAKNPNAARVEGTASGPAPAGAAGGVGWGTRTRQILLTGVSYMIPFVAAGGLLIALGFLFGGYEIANKPAGESQPLLVGNIIALNNSLTNLPSGGFSQYLGAVLFSLGGLAFIPCAGAGGLHRLRDRRSARHRTRFHRRCGRGVRRSRFHRRHRRRSDRRIRCAVDQQKQCAAMVPGLDAGGDHPAVRVLGRRPADVHAARPPTGAGHHQPDDWLSGMSGTSAIALGIILGLMMCFDLGGPVNKAAYAFATAGLAAATTASFEIMAAVMAAGMVPPLAMALASTVRPGLFTEPERENGRAAWLLAHASSPKERSRSRPPTRCASSRR